MPVEKFSISLPEDLVAALDELAAEDGLTRSALIREATASYVTHRTSAAREEERRARIDSAIEGFRRVGEQWGPDERTAAEVLREFRESEGHTDA
jgi:metal-responsive CopG/Arc/MetJ family transcriptional regulator